MNEDLPGTVLLNDSWLQDLKVHEMTGRCEGSFLGVVLGHVGFIQQICGWFSGCQNHDVSLPTRGWCLQSWDALKLNIETLCWPVCPPHNIQYTEYFWMLFPTGPYLSLAPQNPTNIADSIRIPSLDSYRAKKIGKLRNLKGGFIYLVERASSTFVASSESGCAITSGSCLPFQPESGCHKIVMGVAVLNVFVLFLFLDRSRGWNGWMRNCLVQTALILLVIYINSSTSQTPATIRNVSWCFSLTTAVSMRSPQTPWCWWFCAGNMDATNCNVGRLFVLKLWGRLQGGPRA